MTRYRSNQQEACFGVFPNRWRFAVRQLLISLVFVAAVVQIVPVGLASSRGVVESITDSQASESVSPDTHAVEHWATQPTTAARVIDEKSNDLPLEGSLVAIVSGSAHASFLRRGQTYCDRDIHRRCRVTLVNLNVRLQV